MDKNWLIRTKSNHILGPVSRDKVLELVRNGSIRPEDELCSGNGYWFYLREKDLYERYLVGGETQAFNPICEAPDVFRSGPSVAVPSADDITLVGQIPQLQSLRVGPPSAPAAVAPAPLPDDVRPTGRAPAVEEITAPTERAGPPPAVPGKKPRRPAVARPLPVAPLPQRRVSDKVVMWGAVMLLLVLATALYYRKRLIYELSTHAISLLVPHAYADEASAGKKKAH